MSALVKIRINQRFAAAVHHQYIHLIFFFFFEKENMIYKYEFSQLFSSYYANCVHSDWGPFRFQRLLVSFSSSSSFWIRNVTHVHIFISMKKNLKQFNILHHFRFNTIHQQWKLRPKKNGAISVLNFILMHFVNEFSGWKQKVQS